MRLLFSNISGKTIKYIKKIGMTFAYKPVIGKGSLPIFDYLLVSSNLFYFLMLLDSHAIFNEL